MYSERPHNVARKGRNGRPAPCRPFCPFFHIRAISCSRSEYLAVSAYLGSQLALARGFSKGQSANYNSATFSLDKSDFSGRTTLELHYLWVETITMGKKNCQVEGKAASRRLRVVSVLRLISPHVGGVELSVKSRAPLSDGDRYCLGKFELKGKCLS